MPVRARLLPLAFVLAASPAVAAPDVDALTARDRDLARSERVLEQRLGDARASLAVTRGRAEAVRRRYAAQVEMITTRLRYAYAQPTPSPLEAAVTGDIDAARAQADLNAAVERSDHLLLASYRLTVSELEAAERDVAARKQRLSGRQRILAARRATVRAQLRAARAAAEDEESIASAARTEAAAAPGQGLPADVVAQRRLPGSAPIDAATGVPVSLRAPGGAPAIDPSGFSNVTMAAERYDGPHRITPATVISGAAEGYLTAAGVPYHRDAMMAMHRTIPLGTAVRVRHGNREVVVRIVDRGPFVAGHDLAVSPGVAARLGMTVATTTIAEVQPG